MISVGSLNYQEVKAQDLVAEVIWKTHANKPPLATVNKPPAAISN